jgi:AAA15 family ATPase/GTPase
MFINFSLSNYKSFKNKTTLSFVASSIKEYQETHVIESERFSLLKSVAVYGANASGKSNFLKGLVFMRWFVINSSKETQAKEPIDVDPFRLNSSTESEPSEFEVEMLIDEVRYRYGFRTDNKRILAEWLFEGTKNKEYPCFLRIEQDFKLWKRFEEGEKLESKTRDNALFLSVVSQFNGKKAQDVIGWFDNVTPIHGLNLSEGNYSKKTAELLMDEEHSSFIKDLIRKADFGIEDISIGEFDLLEIGNENFKAEVERLKTDFGINLKTINTHHKKFDENGDYLENIKFNLNKEESEGTRKFFAIIGFIYEAVKSGKTVIMDEFDSRLHTLLCTAVLEVFNSKSNLKGQFLFTTHDTNLMIKGFLRRDQIYRVEKNDFGSSDLRSIVEYKPRIDAPIEDKYLGGRYGGIPFIQDFTEALK